MMSDQSMAEMSRSMGTTDVIQCPELIPTDAMHANVLKAFIGTLAKENGDKHARNFVIDLIMPYLQDKHILELWDFQAIDALKQILKNDKLPPYEARLLRETGRNTVQSCFMVGLYVNQKLIGSGNLL